MDPVSAALPHYLRRIFVATLLWMVSTDWYFMHSWYDNYGFVWEISGIEPKAVSSETYYDYLLKFQVPHNISLFPLNLIKKEVH